MNSSNLAREFGLMDWNEESLQEVYDQFKTTKHPDVDLVVFEIESVHGREFEKRRTTARRIAKRHNIPIEAAKKLYMLANEIRAYERASHTCFRTGNISNRHNALKVSFEARNLLLDYITRRDLYESEHELWSLFAGGRLDFDAICQMVPTL